MDRDVGKEGKSVNKYFIWASQFRKINHFMYLNFSFWLHKRSQTYLDMLRRQTLLVICSLPDSVQKRLRRKQTQSKFKKEELCFISTETFSALLRECKQMENLNIWIQLKKITVKWTMACTLPSGLEVEVQVPSSDYFKGSVYVLFVLRKQIHTVHKDSVTSLYMCINTQALEQ